MQISTLITLLIIYVVIMSVIEFKKSPRYSNLENKVQQSVKYAKDFSEITQQNIGIDFDPPRKPPLSFLEKETKLGNFIPQIFNNFSLDDWQDFWAVIYNPIKEKKGSFTVKRYRTEKEIEEYFKSKYPDPFAKMQKEHWDYFWKIIFGRE